MRARLSLIRKQRSFACPRASHGAEVRDLNLDECKQLMNQFMETNLTLWKDDIAEL
jgi:hypothetical protein